MISLTWPFEGERGLIKGVAVIIYFTSNLYWRLLTREPWNDKVESEVEEGF